MTGCQWDENQNGVDRCVAVLNDFQSSESDGAQCYHFNKDTKTDGKGSPPNSFIVKHRCISRPP